MKGVFFAILAEIVRQLPLTRLYNNREAVFSVLRDPCRGNIRQTNSEASSCRSTEDYKEYKRVREEFEVHL
jgi:hypothetical protein